jgi:hypothetical protein
MFAVIRALFVEERSDGVQDIGPVDGVLSIRKRSRLLYTIFFLE